MTNIAQLGFEHINPKFIIDKPIRLIELFAGIGAQAKALENLGVDLENYRICEFDKFAVKSYNAIHGTDFETSDITKLTASDLAITDTNKYCYIMTYSFPCQDLSLAGKRRGMSKGGNTRSGLLWEVERLLNECAELPQVLLMENVTQVHSAANAEDFTKWQQFLESKGYTNFTADLNAKDYGVPQNRNRCFMVSILGNYSYTFPLPIPLTKRLKDVLEHVVDEKYYLSNKAVKYITKPERLEKNFTNISADVAIPITAKGQSNWTGSFVSDCSINEIGYIEKGTGQHQSNTVYGDNGIMECLSATDYKHQLLIKQVAQIYPNSGNPQYGRIYDSNGMCCALGCAEGGNGMPKIIDDTYKNRNSREYENIAQTLRSCRIRKLTPKECWRLMSFDDADIDNCIAAGISNSQLYKQAGNSIVVKVLMAIFKEMI